MMIDHAGNESIPEVFTVLKKVNGPSVTFTSSPHINTSNLASYNLMGTYSENGRDVSIQIANLSVETTPCGSGSFSYTRDLSSAGLSEGVITITADHDDASGDPADQASVSVTKDTVLPTVSFTSNPSDISPSNETSFSISGSCSENSRSVTLTIGSLSPQEITCSSGSFSLSSFDVSGASNGCLIITADHSDLVGNSAEQARFGVFKTSDVVSHLLLTHNDNSLCEFGGGGHIGVGSSTGSLVLTASTNTSELDESWTPKYSDLIAYYKFENNWDDSSVNSYNLTSVNGTSFTSINPKVGNSSASFDGVNDYITTGGFSPTKKSISFWVKLNSASDFPIVYDGTDIWNSNNWNFSAFVFSGSMMFRCHPGSLGQVTVSATINTWTFFVIVREDGGDCVVYQNGSEVGRDLGGGGSSNSILRIGKGVSNHFDGYLDELGIWSSALNNNDVMQIYERQKAKFAGTFTSRVMNIFDPSSLWSGFTVKTPLPFGKELTGDVDGDNIADSEDSSQYSELNVSLSSGLAGLWQFEEVSWSGSSNEVRDSSGHGHHGTIFNDSKQLSDGRFGKTADFDGTNDYIQINSIPLNPGTGNFTISAWVRTTDNDVNPGIFSSYASNSAISVVLSAKAFRIRDADNDLAQAELSTPETVLDGKWHHLVGVRTSVDTVEFYVDGVLVDTDTNINTGSIDINRNPTIGTLSAWPTGYPSHNIDASIDEVALWNRALSINEILHLYRRGANRLKYQVRSCDDVLCNGEAWVGPDGTSNTYFSELHNRMASGNYSPTGMVQTDPLSIFYTDFSSLLANQYFQYRVIMESDDQNNLCSGGPCMPSIESFEALP